MTTDYIGRKAQKDPNVIGVDATTIYPHQIKHDYPLNLSILISGGKETNWDVLSNGE
jgi:hypothetical protein